MRPVQTSGINLLLNNDSSTIKVAIRPRISTLHNNRVLTPHKVATLLREDTRRYNKTTAAGGEVTARKVATRLSPMEDTRRSPMEDTSSSPMEVSTRSSSPMAAIRHNNRYTTSRRRSSRAVNL
jgi:hypothetical protein